MEVFIFAILIGLIPAYIAKGKGRSFGLWWFYGAALFIVALPHALIMKPDSKSLEQQHVDNGMKKCPFCAEFIKPEAMKCRYCGESVSASKTIFKENQNFPTSDPKILDLSDFVKTDIQPTSINKCPICKNGLIRDESDHKNVYWWCPDCQKKFT